VGPTQILLTFLELLFPRRLLMFNLQ